MADATPELVLASIKNIAADKTALNKIKKDSVAAFDLAYQSFARPDITITKANEQKLLDDLAKTCFGLELVRRVSMEDDAETDPQAWSRFMAEFVVGKHVAAVVRRETLGVPTSPGSETPVDKPAELWKPANNKVQSCWLHMAGRKTQVRDWSKLVYATAYAVLVETVVAYQAHSLNAWGKQGYIHKKRKEEVDARNFELLSPHDKNLFMEQQCHAGVLSDVIFYTSHQLAMAVYRYETNFDTQIRRPLREWYSVYKAKMVENLVPVGQQRLLQFGLILPEDADEGGNGGGGNGDEDDDDDEDDDFDNSNNMGRGVARGIVSPERHSPRRQAQLLKNGVDENEDEDDDEEGDEEGDDDGYYVPVAIAEDDGDYEAMLASWLAADTDEDEDTVEEYEFHSVYNNASIQIAGRPGQGEYMTGFCPACGGFDAYMSWHNKEEGAERPKMIHIHKKYFPPLFETDEGAGWEIDFDKTWPSEISGQRGAMYRHYRECHANFFLPRALRPKRKKTKRKANGKIDWCTKKRRYLKKKEEERLEAEAEAEAEAARRERKKARKRRKAREGGESGKSRDDEDESER
jgi:hypothetical protein